LSGHLFSAHFTSPGLGVASDTAITLLSARSDAWYINTDLFSPRQFGGLSVGPDPSSIEL
jgi:hypothetical protein